MGQNTPIFVKALHLITMRTHKNKKKLDIQTRIRISELIRMVGHCKNKIILDLGSYKLNIVDNLNCKKIIRLDAVRENGINIKCNLNYDNIPLKDESVDIIMAGELIEHIRSTVFFLNECNRVLKKGGFIVLSTPNMVNFTDRIKVLFGKLPLNCCKYENKNYDRYNSHVRDFNLKLITKALEDAGFKLVDKKTNGIILHSKLIFPLRLTPITFGQNFILKAIK